MSAQPSLFDGARVRTTDPQTSVDAANVQDPKGCAADILRALADRKGFVDLTSHDIWSRYCGWREPGTVRACLSRLMQSGLVRVTGTRVPHGKRVAQSTFKITDAGREALR